MKIQYYLLFSVFILLASCKSDTPVEKSSGDAAIDQLNEQIKANPNDPSLLVLRAEKLVQNQSFEEAVEDLQKAIAIDSLQPDYFHKLSDAFMDYYKSRAALQIMEQAAQRFPERIPTLLKLSETQLIIKDYGASIATVNNILGLDPQNAEAFFMLGLNFVEQGDTSRAINSFQTAVENNPELIDGWLYIGSLFEDQKSERALDYYNAAINANPNSIEALHHKAFYLQNHDRMDEAVNIYNQINAIDKNYEAAYLNKGILFLEKDSISRAYEEFNILIGLKPQNAVAYFYRGLCRQMENKLTAAAQDYNAAIALDPNMDRARRALADLPSE